MISIIIPLFNRAHQLPKALDSILKQSYQNFELIIVNDGSTDKTEKVLYEYKQKFKQGFVIINQENQGAPKARNRGREEAQGNFLLFCDADAILAPKALESWREALIKNRQIAYAYSNFYWGYKLFKLFPFDEEKLKQMPYIHSTSLIRRESFANWDENIKRLQDWDLWLSMLKKGHKGIWVDQTLFKKQSGATMSKWLPSFVYKFFPNLKSVKKYNEAVAVIKKKHNLY